MGATRVSRGLDNRESRALWREVNDPAYRRRVERALAGRTVVQYVRDLRREIEAEDERKRARRAKNR